MEKAKSIKGNNILHELAIKGLFDLFISFAEINPKLLNMKNHSGEDPQDLLSIRMLSEKSVNMNELYNKLKDIK